MNKKAAKPGSTVALSNTDAGFFDPVTGFKIVRSAQRNLGKTIGTKTQRAIMSGALVVVGKGSDADTQAEAEADAAKELDAIAKESLARAEADTLAQEEEKAKAAADLQARTEAEKKA